MTVNISPNIKRTRITIDADGNEVVPFTKQVVKKNEPEYTPTAEELKSAMAKPPSDATPKDALKELEQSPQPSGGVNLEAMISKKIEALVEKKVNEVLEKMLS